MPIPKRKRVEGIKGVPSPLSPLPIFFSIIIHRVIPLVRFYTSTFWIYHLLPKRLSPTGPLPPLLFCLYYFSNEERYFKAIIQGYNSALAFTFVNYSWDDHRGLEKGGIQSFQIHGEIYHLQGPLNPSSGQRPRLAPLYFYDPSYAAQPCSTTNLNIKEALLRSIMEELEEVNSWYRMYLTAHECQEHHKSENKCMQVFIHNWS